MALTAGLAIELAGAAEQAAIAAAAWRGRGDEKAADQAAVDAMRRALNAMPMRGEVVIGEGERDEAPMLFIGEKVGRQAAGDPEMDIALDPLEGTTLTAKGMSNALAVVAMTDKGGFLNAPDVYMEKLVLGGGYPAGVVSLAASPAENVAAVARASGREPAEVGVCVLDRPRHEALLASLREVGARITLISDGDVAGAMHATDAASGIDLYMGTGGAPEGVLAAAALHCLGGQMEGRLVFSDDKQKERAKKMGVTDLEKIFTLGELASGDVIFAATGVTDGSLVHGVRQHSERLHDVQQNDNKKITTQTLLLHAGMERRVTTLHGI